ncbi:MAG: hypothetical protein HY506_00435 [Candidatus Yanofskybacteria bacterium]|nr:hypothetical protein [Candidatus Yanofskybacteria bacterium]
MDIGEILREQQRITEELFKGKARNFLIGEHRSPFKGSGYEIHGIAEWQHGDPIEDINLPLSLPTWPKKIFVTRKIKTKIAPVILIADLSPSILVGIDEIANKFHLEISLLLTLGLAAIFYHDPVGMLCFSDRIEFYLRPKFGLSRLLYAMEQMLKKSKEREDELLGGKTKLLNRGAILNSALGFLAATLKSQCSIVILSDFADAINGKTAIDLEMFRILSAKHSRNVIAVFLDDPKEFSWGRARGRVPVMDVESGVIEEVRANRADKVRQEFCDKREELRKDLEGAGVDSAVISYGDHLNQLSQFLAQRKK